MMLRDSDVCKAKETDALLRNHFAQASCMQMQADGVSRRDLLAGVAGAAIVAAPALANAEVEYPNVPYLGGSDQVQL
jgi:hypothetical protein